MKIPEICLIFVTCEPLVDLASPRSETSCVSDPRGSSQLGDALPAPKSPPAGSSTCLSTWGSVRQGVTSTPRPADPVTSCMSQPKSFTWLLVCCHLLEVKKQKQNKKIHLLNEVKKNPEFLQLTMPRKKIYIQHTVVYAPFAVLVSRPIS